MVQLAKLELSLAQLSPSLFLLLLFALFKIYIQLSEKIDAVDVKVAALFDSFNLMME